MEPKIAQKSPYVTQESSGRRRAWCACGLSAIQPFCDGSHSREKSDLAPVVVSCERDGEYAWCGCKQTGTPPYCDGTHSRL